MYIFTFFKFFEIQDFVKCIDFHSGDIKVYLINGTDITISISGNGIKTMYFYLYFNSSLNIEVKFFLKLFLKYEKYLLFNHNDLEDYIFSLKQGYSIFYIINKYSFIVNFPDCNNKCSFCETHYQYKERRGFSYKNIINAFNFFSKIIEIRQVDLFGGEPTIHKDFLRILDYCDKQKNIKLTLATNGRTFTNMSLLDSIRGKLYGIRISFHSIVEKEFINVTGINSSYKETILGIENLYKLGFSNVLVNLVITKNNFNSIYDTLDKLYKINTRLFFKLSGIFCSDKDTLDDIYKVYPSLMDIYDLINNKLIKFFHNNNLVIFIEKLPYCIINSNYYFHYETEKGNNENYDDICILCNKKERCTILPLVQLEYINNNITEKDFFLKLRKEFIKKQNNNYSLSKS